jgi:hypothetical protein
MFNFSILVIDEYSLSVDRLNLVSQFNPPEIALADFLKWHLFQKLLEEICCCDEQSADH